MNADKVKKFTALASLVVFSGLLAGQNVSARVEQFPPVVELRLFGFAVKVWAVGDSYTVEVIKSPVAKPSPVGR